VWRVVFDVAMLLAGLVWLVGCTRYVVSRDLEFRGSYERSVRKPLVGWYYRASGLATHSFRIMTVLFFPGVVMLIVGVVLLASPQR